MPRGTQYAGREHAFGARTVGVVTIGIRNVEGAAGYCEASQRHTYCQADNKRNRDTCSVAKSDRRIHFRGVDVQHTTPERSPFIELRVRRCVAGGFRRRIARIECEWRAIRDGIWMRDAVLDRSGFRLQFLVAIHPCSPFFVC